jgi:predicted DNA-binding mobile mystery protein A
MLLRPRQLDKQLSNVRRHLVTPPSGGWIKTIREALGMNLETLGQRLGVTRQTAHQLEAAEVDGSITLRRLRAAANALECDVAVVLVPRVPLENLVNDRARHVATQQLKRVAHSMAMEAQAIDDKHRGEMIRELAERLIAQRDPSIWA